MLPIRLPQEGVLRHSLIDYRSDRMAPNKTVIGDRRD
jgi:hypothetical protein